MPMKTLSRPTSLFTTASLSQPSWTPSRPSHAEATQPRDVSSLRTPWTRLLCLPNPTTPACRPWSMTKVCCCGKRPIGLGACTARPHCLLGASKKSRPAWPGSTAAGSSEAGRRLGRRPQSSSPDHSRSEKPVPPRGAERPGTQERTTESTFYCRELVCCHVQRPQQHEGCGFSFYFISTFPFLWVSLSSLRSRCFLPPAVPGHRELCGGIAQTESLRGALGRSPGPLQGRDAQNGNCTRTSSFAVWTEELMVVFRDCADHVDYMSQVVNKWLEAVLHKCLPTCPLLSRNTQLRGWLGQPASPGT